MRTPTSIESVDGRCIIGLMQNPEQIRTVSPSPLEKHGRKGESERFQALHSPRLRGGRLCGGPYPVASSRSQWMAHPIAIHLARMVRYENAEIQECGVLGRDVGADEGAVVRGAGDAQRGVRAGVPSVSGVGEDAGGSGARGARSGACGVQGIWVGPDAGVDSRGPALGTGRRAAGRVGLPAVRTSGGGAQPRGAGGVWADGVCVCAVPVWGRVAVGEGA